MGKKGPCDCPHVLRIEFSWSQCQPVPRPRAMDIQPRSFQPVRQGYDFSKSVGKIEHVKFDFGKGSLEGASVDQTLATLFDTLTVECR